ncbi:hypothetical protein ACIO14_23680 [Nocardia fluminea]|uniref:hypothetical protein n=1 Tax=Nocardia fluminea TaxID=134984 RepID=UPI0037F63CC9
MRPEVEFRSRALGRRSHDQEPPPQLLLLPPPQLLLLPPEQLLPLPLQLPPLPPPQPLFEPPPQPPDGLPGSHG